MWALISTVFLASLAGSPHCAAMCGPFVGFYAPAMSAGARWPGHAAHAGGRLLVYLALGAAAGIAGRGIDLAGAAAGYGGVAAPIASALMIAWGTVALLGQTGRLAPRRAARPGPATVVVGRALRAVHGGAPVARAGLVGLSSALLPCGWLYAFVVSAAGTGSAGRGALTMLAFWAGTVPVLTGVAALVGRGGARLRRAAPRAAAALVIAAGLLGLAARLPAPAGAGSGVHPRSCHGHG